jgi:hypothetical protein
MVTAIDLYGWKILFPLIDRAFSQLDATDAYESLTSMSNLMTTHRRW